jgi:hypothetical protein
MVRGIFRFIAKFVCIALITAALVGILWTATLFTTPGFLVANRVISAEPPSFLGHIGEGFEISAFVDFAVFFMALWGVRFLWVEFGRQRRRGGSRIQQLSSPRKADLVISCFMCALPMSFYVVFGLALLFNRGRLPQTTIWLVIVIALGWITSSAAIFGAFALAMKWQSRTAVS